MRRQYRNGGLTVALGRPPIAYTEGRCAGGGSEVNSGLYHRPGGGPARGVVVALRRRRPRRGDAGAAPRRGRAAARSRPDRAEPRGPPPRCCATGPRASAGPRTTCRAGRPTDPATGVPERQTMTRTYLADAVAAGAEVRTGQRVDRLEVEHGRVTGVRVGGEVVRGGPGRRLRRSRADAGAAPAQRDHPPRGLAVGAPHGQGGRGLRRRGQRARRASRPGRCASSPPRLTLGGSASRPELVALALADSWSRLGDRVARWRHQQVYYAAIRSRGRGRVRAAAGLRGPAGDVPAGARRTSSC